MKQVKKYKLSRRLRIPLFEKCQTQKFALREQRRQPKFTRSRMTTSDFSRQLLEKQKVRFLYNISEKTLKNYVRGVEGNVSGEQKPDLLAELLERRLDSIVYRLKLAETRRMAKQIVSHGHITVNGKKILSSAYAVKDSDKIGVREGSKATAIFKTKLEKMQSPVDWLSWDSKEKTGQIKNKPLSDEGVFNLSEVLEYYSR